MLGRRGHRGATLVEYVLLVAVLAVGTIGGLQAMASGAEQATARTAESISRRTLPSVPEGGGSPTSIPVTTTTTTKPPTTTTTVKPTTTTTTVKPTTTTTTTTTTTAPATATASWGSTSAQKSGNQWKALATLTVVDNRGRPVSGAQVRIGVQYFMGDKWRDAADLSASTSAAGQISVDSGWYARAGNPNSRVEQIRFVVESVTGTGMTYTSGPISTTLDRP